MIKFTINILCAYVATFLSIIILTDGNWLMIFNCAIALLIYTIFSWLAVKLSEPPVNKLQELDVASLNFEYKFKTVPVITEKIAIKSGFSKDNINILKYFVIDKYIPKANVAKGNKNSCFGTIPNIKIEDFDFNICKCWVAKNGKDKQKIIFATSIESALFKLNIWAMLNDSVNWSLLKMTRFSESKKVGIFEYNEFKDNFIL